MAGADAVFYLVIGLFGGLSFFIMGFHWLKRKKMIENIPTSKTRSIAMGLVEIFGKVVPLNEGVLKSPFTNTDCVYYRYKIEELRNSGKHSYWATIRKGEDNRNFHLKDETGEVLVDPNGAELDIPVDFDFKSGLGKDPPKEIRDFLSRNSLSFEGFLGLNKQMRFREHIIAPGDKVYVMGTASDNPAVKTARMGVEDVIIRKGANDKIFYISDRPEKDILGSLKWKSYGGIIGGTLLSIASLLFLFLYFGFL